MRVVGVVQMPGMAVVVKGSRQPVVHAKDGAVWPKSADVLRISGPGGTDCDPEHVELVVITPTSAAASAG